MRTKLWFAIGAVVMLAVVVALPLAGAEIISQKVRVVYDIVKAEVIQVGDVPGHVVGVAEGRGIAFPDNGEVGTFSNRIYFDYINGSGTHWSYAQFTFEDGSTCFNKSQGTTTALPGGKSSYEGTITYIKGTGRFEGIQGGGPYAGRRLAPLAPGVPADSYFDLTATYTLRSR